METEEVKIITPSSDDKNSNTELSAIEWQTKLDLTRTTIDVLSDIMKLYANTEIDGKAFALATLLSVLADDEYGVFNKHHDTATMVIRNLKTMSRFANLEDLAKGVCVVGKKLKACPESCALALRRLVEKAPKTVRKTAKDMTDDDFTEVIEATTQKLRGCFRIFN